MPFRRDTLGKRLNVEVAIHIFPAKRTHEFTRGHAAGDEKMVTIDNGVTVVNVDTEVITTINFFAGFRPPHPHRDLIDEIFGDRNDVRVIESSGDEEAINHPQINTKLVTLETH